MANNMEEEGREEEWTMDIFMSWHDSPYWARDSPVVEATRSHSDTTRSVGLLWTSDQPDAETATR